MAGSMSGSGAAGPHFNAPPVSTPQHLHGTAGTPAMAASPVQQVAPARKQSPPADWALKLQQVYMSDAGQGHRPGQTSMRVCCCCPMQCCAVHVVMPCAWAGLTLCHQA